MSNLAEKIFDIEMDYLGNIYHTSFNSNKVYKINAKTCYETVLIDLEKLQNEEEFVGKNLKCSQDRKYLFIKTGYEKIAIYECIRNQEETEMDNLPVLGYIKMVKVKGTIVSISNLYDRMAVITSTGKINIYNYKNNPIESIHA
jgi:hypothetical protein